MIVFCYIYIIYCQLYANFSFLLKFVNYVLWSWSIWLYIRTCVLEPPVCLGLKGLDFSILNYIQMPREDFFLTYFSQLLYLGRKSRDMTWPHTLVILYFTFSLVAGNCSTHSATLQAPLDPFLELHWFLNRIQCNNWKRIRESCDICNTT